METFFETLMYKNCFLGGFKALNDVPKINRPALTFLFLIHQFRFVKRIFFFTKVPRASDFKRSHELYALGEMVILKQSPLTTLGKPWYMYLVKCL